MFKALFESIEKFDRNHPYLMSLIIFIVASIIGITIQYLIDGRIIKSGFYPAASLTLVSLLTTWLKRRKDE